jgi:hypothetical protein
MEYSLSEKLYHLAILGTTRVAIPPQLIQKLKEWGIDPDTNPEKALLQALTFQRQWQKAGFPLPKWEYELPASELERDTEVCSLSSQQLLQKIVDETFAEALPEFIALLKKNGQLLPPIVLPHLFNRCLEEPPFFMTIEPVIGKCGQWLLQQNPQWHSLCLTTDSTEWLVAPFGVRQNMLLQLRKTNPRQAIDLLQSTWETERPEHRAEFLNALHEGLNPSDEAFLYSTLADRRREVRQVAADLLVLLPNSKLALEYITFAQTCFLLEEKNKKPSLVRVFPKELPAEWRSHGIETMGTGPLTDVQRQSWGFQLLRRIPCRYWSDSFNASPTSILEAFVSATRDDNWLQAFADACQLHPNEEWSEAIVRFWIDKNIGLSWNSTANHQFLQHLSAESFNRIASQFLEKNPQLLEDRHLITYLLSTAEHPWGDQLTLLVLRPFQRYVNGSLGQLLHAWHYTRILKALAYHCNPELLLQLSKDWDPTSGLWSRWQKEVEKMLEIIAFRQKISHCFGGDPNLK